MFFRLLSYSALLYLVTLLLPEAGFNFFKIVTGENKFTNTQLISVLSIITSVELFINFTSAGKALVRNFYRCLTIIRVFLVISLISTAVVARSNHFDVASDKLSETCKSDSLKSICDTGKGVIDTLIHQVGMFF